MPLGQLIKTTDRVKGVNGVFLLQRSPLALSSGLNSPLGRQMGLSIAGYVRVSRARSLSPKVFCQMDRLHVS